MVHESGHALIDGLDTTYGFHGFQFTGHGLTSPGFYIGTIYDTNFGRASGLIFSLVFVLGAMRLHVLRNPYASICIVWVFWLARWDMIYLVSKGW